MAQDIATFRVRDGYRLAHGGVVHEAGTLLELPRAIAADIAVRGHVQEVDADGHPVEPPPPDDLARFRTHERFGKLKEDLAAAEARVEQIKGRLAAEEQQLAQEVAAAAAAREAEVPAPVAPATSEPPATDIKPSSTPKKSAGAKE